MGNMLMVILSYRLGLEWEEKALDFMNNEERVEKDNCCKRFFSRVKLEKIT